MFEQAQDRSGVEEIGFVLQGPGQSLLTICQEQGANRILPSLLRY